MFARLKSLSPARLRAFALACVALVAIAGAGAARAEPLAERRCVALRDSLEASIGITPAFEMWEADDADLRPLSETASCRLFFRSTGVIFETEGRRGFAAAAESIRAALLSEGWAEGEEQLPFAGDAPMATRFAVARGSDLCVVNVSLQATKDRVERSGAPRSTGEVMRIPLYQRLYTVQLDCITR